LSPDSFRARRMLVTEAVGHFRTMIGFPIGLIQGTPR
jgi:hypothetical protein